MHDAVPAVSRFGNKGFRPAPIAGRKARSGNIIVRRTSKIGRHPVKQRFFTIFAADNPTAMNFKKISLLILILLIADQLLKIWVKTHMHLDESIIVFPDWFQLRFIENNGAAFGMHIASKGGFDWGKLLLGIFRIVMVGLIGWLMHHLLQPPGGYAEGSHRRSGAGDGRSARQYHRQRILRTDLFGIDAVHGSAFRRTLRRAS